MPSWLVDEMDGLSDVVPQIPDWLLEAPVSVEEPRCECGGATLSELVAEAAAEPVKGPVEEPVRWA
ncbi:MAG: hypothetical protein M3P04_14830, partial [Actinomycetota bacterium]|nr:hypothetical protein [Actinomycetota bacterium]